MRDPERYCRKGKERARRQAARAEGAAAARFEARAEVFGELLELLEG